MPSLYSDAYVQQYLRTLAARPPVDIHIYLDERGTPATDRRFITAGIAFYGEDVDAFRTRWREFASASKVAGKKGRTLRPRQLADVAAFLATEPLLPVGYHTHLAEDELDALRRFAKNYERSTSPAKRFSKVSAASFLWKQQMPIAAGTAFTSIVLRVGPVARASLHTDRMSDPPGVQEFYREMLGEQLARERFAPGVTSGAPPALAEFVTKSMPEQWDIDMNANGPLAAIADIACTMYENWLAAVHREPWDMMRHELARRDDGKPPKCSGIDGTPEMREWLARLFTEGDPDVHG